MHCDSVPFVYGKVHVTDEAERIAARPAESGAARKRCMYIVSQVRELYCIAQLVPVNDLRPSDLR